MNSLFPLSEDEWDKRYDYSFCVPLFDQNDWRNQGWRPLLSYRRKSDDSDFTHEQVAVNESIKLITCRVLPIHVEYVNEPDSGSVATNWYIYRGENIADPKTQAAVHAEAEQVYEEFLHAAIELEARGVITIDFESIPSHQHLQLAHSAV